VTPPGTVTVTVAGEGEQHMAGPTPEQIDHYVRTFERIADGPWCPAETCWWTVVRPLRGTLTVADVVRRLHGDPDAMTVYRPADLDYEDDKVFVEQRDDAVVVLGCTLAGIEDYQLPQLSDDATVHGVFWLVNNYNRLYRHVDGEVRTELDVLRPRERWGTDPEGLTDHLGALVELRDRDTGPWPDWETAMATMESLTGLRLDADWFRRPQRLATVDAP
jgi:hypothetical protein